MQVQIEWLCLVGEGGEVFQFNCDQMDGKPWLSLLAVNAAVFLE